MPVVVEPGQKWEYIGPYFQGADRVIYLITEVDEHTVYGFTPVNEGMKDACQLRLTRDGQDPEKIGEWRLIGFPPCAVCDRPARVEDYLCWPCRVQS